MSGYRVEIPRGTALIASKLRFVVPVCFVLGACMELFMVKTGFYTIVTKKEAERREERRQAHEKKVERMKALSISIDGTREGKK